MTIGTYAMSALTLSGDKVRNPEGEELGRLEDFVLDLGTGRIVYAVMSFGGIMGIGTKLFAIPPSALTAALSPRSLPQSSTGRLLVMRVLQRS